MAQRTTRITIETETQTILRHARTVLAWCPQCHAEVDVIDLPSTSLSDPETASQIQGWMKHGGLHLWHLPDDTVQICVRSLLQSSAPAEERQPRLP